MVEEGRADDALCDVVREAHAPVWRYLRHERSEIRTVVYEYDARDEYEHEGALVQRRDDQLQRRECGLRADVVGQHVRKAVEGEECHERPCQHLEPEVGLLLGEEAAAADEHTVHEECGRLEEAGVVPRPCEACELSLHEVHAYHFEERRLVLCGCGRAPQFGGGDIGQGECRVCGREDEIYPVQRLQQAYGGYDEYRAVRHAACGYQHEPHEGEQYEHFGREEYGVDGIIVYDTGTGVSKSMEDILFEPLQSGKPLSEGRGMGLYIVRKLLESFGGEIELLDERNEYGNRYKFLLVSNTSEEL